jgi:copper chaperone CopZ
VATVNEIVQVKGIRCERCMARLAKVLEGHEGLDSANADFQGRVSLVYDDELTSRDALLAEMLRGGFREVQETAA